MGKMTIDLESAKRMVAEEEARIQRRARIALTALLCALMAVTVTLCVLGGSEEAHAAEEQTFRIDNVPASGAAYSSSFTAVGDADTETWAVWAEDRSGTAPELAVLDDAQVSISCNGEELFSGPLSGIADSGLAMRANVPADAAVFAYSMALGQPVDPAVAGAAKVYWHVLPMSHADLMDAADFDEAAVAATSDEATADGTWGTVLGVAGVIALGAGTAVLGTWVYRRIRVEGPTQKS